MSGASRTSSSKPRLVAASQGQRLPLFYNVFFLLIEPVAALVGAYYAHFRPEEYLRLTHVDSLPPSPLPLGTSVALSQLGNLYFFFALNEALVLRSTSDLTVWRTVLVVLLVADLGHLYAVRTLGSSIYYDAPSWNAIDWGNVPFVYFGAAMRMAFLAGVGMAAPQAQGKKRP